MSRRKPKQVEGRYLSAIRSNPRELWVKAIDDERRDLFGSVLEVRLQHLDGLPSVSITLNVEEAERLQGQLRLLLLGEKL